MSRKNIFLLLAVALAPALLVLMDGRPAFAGGTVTICSNDTDFSSKLAGGGTVDFSCGPATIFLGSTKTITQSTTINGGNVITLSGSSARRLFIVQSPATLTLTNITIQDGNSGASDGGAVYVFNGGALGIVGSRFYSNTTGSSQGGGAITTYGALNISNSEFAYNKAGGGGAINSVFGGANAVISNSNFHDNATLGGNGGAIYIRDAAPMTLTQVTLSNNKALSQGGAVFVSGIGSSLNLSNSQVLSNTAATGGGGIYSVGALTVISSTIAHNNANNVGGGLSIETSATLSQTTVYSNTSFSGGGGINTAATASLTLTQDIVTQNYTYGGDGGGIRSLGTLVINNVAVFYNRADAGVGDSYGGGIFHQTGRLTMVQGYVDNNQAKHGGGINMLSGTGEFIVSDFSFNTATSGNGGGLRIAGGSASLVAGYTSRNQANNGAGIFNQGALTITQSLVYLNYASLNGGGIYQSSGKTTVITSSLFHNSACCSGSGGTTGMGGGIYNSAGTVELLNADVDNNIANYRGGGILNFGIMTVDRSTISANVSYGGDQVTQTYGGGGIYNFGTIAVTNSTLRDNSTTTLDGGGFYNGWNANATLTNVTLSNNYAAQDGGGLKNNLGIATLTNVTFSGNIAIGDGGGVYSDHGQTNLRHVTFSGNKAYNGGGIYNITVYPTRTVSLQNTIITNSPSGYNCISNYPGSLTVVSQQFNLSDDGSFDSGGFCPAFGANDQSHANPNLDVLADHGGPKLGSGLEPMLTYLPRPGSPAIDKIPAGFNGCGSTFQSDQRGAPRPYNAYCDIGAMEYLPGDIWERLYLPLVPRQ